MDLGPNFSTSVLWKKCFSRQQIPQREINWARREHRSFRVQGKHSCSMHLPLFFLIHTRFFPTSRSLHMFFCLKHVFPLSIWLAPTNYLFFSSNVPSKERHSLYSSFQVSLSCLDIAFVSFITFLKFHIGLI